MRSLLDLAFYGEAEASDPTEQEPKESLSWSLLFTEKTRKECSALEMWQAGSTKHGSECWTMPHARIHSGPEWRSWPSLASRSPALQSQLQLSQSAESSASCLTSPNLSFCILNWYNNSHCHHFPVCRRLRRDLFEHIPIKGSKSLFVIHSSKKRVHTQDCSKKTKWVP